MMRVQRSQQQGVSALWIILGISVGIFLVTFTLKVAPHYMDFYTISNAVSNALEDPAVGDQGPSQIVSRISKQLYLDNIRGVDVEKALKVSQQAGITTAMLDYNVTEKFFDNDYSDIQLVLHFHKEFTSAGN